MDVGTPALTQPERPQAAWRAVLRSVFTVDWGQIEIKGAIRCTIGVLIPLVVGLATGAVADGVAASVGALCAGFASFQGGYRSRASLTVLVASGMAVSTLVGALSIRNTVSAILVTAVWGGIAGIMVSLGQAGLITGLQWVVAELIAGAIPMTIGQAAVRAGMVMAGGIIQTVLVVSLWPIRTYRLERKAIEAAYSDLAVTAAHISSGEVLSRGATTLNDARQALEDPQPFSRTGQLLAFQALVDEAERIRIELTALARHRSRLADAHAIEALEAIDKLASDAAAILREIATGLAHDGGPRLTAGFADALARDNTTLEEALNASHTPVWVEAQVSTIASALSGQLRSAVDIAVASSGMPAAKRFGGRELPRRRMSPIRTPLETLSANLSWQSTAFRHAVRLAATLAVATLIYRATSLQHGYWVPLTALVILRPDFTSTAVRGVSRIFGTIAGAAVATLVAALLRPDNIGLTVLFTVGVFFAYVVVRANYTLFSITVTSYVVFLLAFAKLPELSAVTYRLTATVIGGGLAFVAYLVWPTWESRLVGPQLADLLDAQADYSEAVLAVLADPKGADRRRIGELRSIARRARSNAEASLERMAAEPTRANRWVPLSLDKATSVLAAARRVAFAVLTLHSDLPPADFAPCPEITPLSRGIGSLLRGDAARLRTLVPSARVHPPLMPASRGNPDAGGPNSSGSGERPVRPGHWDQAAAAGRLGDQGAAAGRLGDQAAAAGRDGAGRRASDYGHQGPAADSDTPEERDDDGRRSRPPATLRQLHTTMAEQLENRVKKGDPEADLIALLIAETDLMVDSVNTISEVLGRVATVSVTA